MKLNKMLRIVEIVWIIFAGICLVEAILNFYNGDTQKAGMFSIGLVMGIVMFFLRRNTRKKMEQNGN